MIGNNQPLIVIDGVRTNNETLNSGSSTAGTAQSNRLMDLNNDDIESINILKVLQHCSLWYSGCSWCSCDHNKKGIKISNASVIHSQVGVDVLSTTIDLQSEFCQGSGDAT